MGFTKKCPKCGLDVPDTASATCPMCGTPLLSLPSSSSRIWIAAAIQIVFAVTFMLLFRFPAVMIVPFVGFILLATAASTWMKANASSARPKAPQPPLAHPVLLRIVGFSLLLCGLGLVSSLLFGFVIFMNSWNLWHQYEGQAYHQSEFQVTQVYFQRGSKGSISAYASGMVEGQKEWMSLIPYLHQIPRSKAQLDELVGSGDTIPILYFPQMKGRARVRFDDGVPPVEAGHRDAMNALKYGSLGFALSSLLIFFLNRLRRLCYDNSVPALQAAYPTQGQ